MTFNEANMVEQMVNEATDNTPRIPALLSLQMGEGRPSVKWLHQINEPPRSDNASQRRRRKDLREDEVRALPQSPILYLRCLINPQMRWREVVENPTLTAQHLRVFYIGEACNPLRLYDGLIHGGYGWRNNPEYQNSPIITAFWFLDAFSTIAPCPSEYFNDKSKRDLAENELIRWFDDKDFKLENKQLKSNRGADKDPIAKAVAQHIISDCTMLGLVH